MLEVMDRDEVKAPHIGAVGDYVKALSAMDLSSCERDMLRAHAKAPGYEITGLKLAETVGHFGCRIGHKKYGRLAAKIATMAGLPICQTDVSDYLAAIFTLADGKQSDGEDWNWTMHEPVVAALKQLVMV
jgi:hypothetical protein